MIASGSKVKSRVCDTVRFAPRPTPASRRGAISPRARYHTDLLAVVGALIQGWRSRMALPEDVHFVAVGTLDDDLAAAFPG